MNPEKRAKLATSSSSTSSSPSGDGSGGLERLLAPLTRGEFFENHWEKKWLHVPATTDNNNFSTTDNNNSSTTPPKAQFFQSLFTLDTFYAILRESPCHLDKDINLVCFKDGVKENMNKVYEERLMVASGEEGRSKTHISGDNNKTETTSNKSHSYHNKDKANDDDDDDSDDDDGNDDDDSQDLDLSPRVTPEVIQQALEDGVSIQFHQPQRFCAPLAELLATLEAQFSCLVGANVYITPPHSQGLAPHHDDIEAFVLQCEGQKKWNIYPPVVHLANTYSNDFPYETIGDAEGSPTLNPGDLLYFSRGQIHEAMATKNTSVHLTISTYQHWTYGDLLQHALPLCLQKCMPSLQSLRAGLPLDLLQSNGICSPLGTQPQLKAKLAEILVASLDDIFRYLPSAIDSFGMDFMQNRLPPSLAEQRMGSGAHASDEDEDEDEEGGVVDGMSMLVPTSQVVLVDPTAQRLVECSTDVMEDPDQTDIDPASYLLLVHSGRNSAHTHMMCDTQYNGDDEGTQPPMMPVPRGVVGMFQELVRAFPAASTVTDLISITSQYMSRNHPTTTTKHNDNDDDQGDSDDDDEEEGVLDANTVTLGFLRMLHDLSLLKTI